MPARAFPTKEPSLSAFRVVPPSEVLLVPSEVLLVPPSEVLLVPLEVLLQDSEWLEEPPQVPLGVPPGSGR